MLIDPIVQIVDSRFIMNRTLPLDKKKMNYRFVINSNGFCSLAFKVHIILRQKLCEFETLKISCVGWFFHQINTSAQIIVKMILYLLSKCLVLNYILFGFSDIRVCAY